MKFWGSDTAPPPPVALQTENIANQVWFGACWDNTIEKSAKMKYWGSENCPPVALQTENIANQVWFGACCDNTIEKSAKKYWENENASPVALTLFDQKVLPIRFGLVLDLTIILKIRQK
jgi:hypothetical protein